MGEASERHRWCVCCSLLTGDIWSYAWHDKSAPREKNQQVSLLLEPWELGASVVAQRPFGSKCPLEYCSLACCWCPWLIVRDIAHGLVRYIVSNIRGLTKMMSSSHMLERGGNFLLIQLLAKTTKQTLLCLTFPILSCLFANLILQIPSHSFVNVTFSSSTNK